MPRRKKSISVVVEPLDAEGKKKFKKKVNEVYCDIIRNKLDQSKLTMDEKKQVLDSLCHFFED